MGGIISLIKPYYKAHLFFWDGLRPGLLCAILIVIIHKIAITYTRSISKVLFASKKNDIDKEFSQDNVLIMRIGIEANSYYKNTAGTESCP